MQGLTYARLQENDLTPAGFSGDECSHVNGLITLLQRHVNSGDVARAAARIPAQAVLLLLQDSRCGS